MKDLIIINDTHINSTVSVCADEVMLDDGGSYMPSKTQRWLNNSLKDFTNFIYESPNDKVFVLLGDIVDLNKHSKYQMISENRAVILQNAYDTLKSVIRDNKTYIVRGTEAHVGESGELEEMFGNMIGSEIMDGSYAAWNLLLNIEGVTFDLAHHGTIGRTPWTKPNRLNSMAAAMIVDYTVHGETLPNVVVRAHNHTFADTHDNFPVRVVSAPAWQMSTSFAHRIGAGLPDIGGLVFRCNSGKYKMHKKLYRPVQLKPIEA